MAVATTRKTTRVIQAANRNRSVKKISLRRPECIATPSNGVDQRLLGAALELATEPINVDFDDVGGPFPVGFPEALAEHLAGNYLSRVTHEQFEDAELGGRE